MKFTKFVFTLMLIAAAAASCIREDLDDCYSVNHLIFSYKGDGTTEIFPEKINRVELFVFDDENNFVNSIVVPDEQVARRTATLPPLREGLYRIVCIGNTHDTEVDGLKSGDYKKMIFADEELFADAVQHGNDSLYYASDMYEVESYLTQTEEKTQVIEFASSHYDLLVEVVGVPADQTTSKAGSSSARLEMRNVTPRTDFENKVTGGMTNYQLETEYDAGKMLLSARTNIMRHKNHQDVNLCFYPAGASEPMVTVNLAEHLAKYPQIDCSKHEVLIPIRIEFKSGLEVNVTVPDWFIVEVKPEF